MITADLLKKIAPTANDKIVSDLVVYLNQYMPTYKVDNYLRVCHFLAQAAHESAGFRTLEEYASGAAYEGRKDLGNVNPGDGKKYKGRGIFQLTGRSNYQSMSKTLNEDLVNNPQLAETGKISTLTALEYWNSRKLSPLADADDVLSITKKINGGTNGLDDRKKYLSVAKSVIPRDFKFSQTQATQQTTPVPTANTSAPASAFNIVVAKVGDNSPYVADLQNMLIKKGANIKADGKYGPMTESAVKDFQSKNKLQVTGSIDTDTLNRLMVQ